MGWGSFLFLLLAGTPALAAIFGDDTRVVITPSSHFAPLGRSTAIAVLASLYTEDQPGKISLSTEPLSESLCPDVRFVNSPSLSYSCTGFLVAPDLIATAGHCLVNTGEDHNETQTYCQAYSWLFDYQTADNGATQIQGLSANNLYHCKQVIYAVQDEHAPFRDYALVQLDRPVLDRQPLKISTKALGPADRFTMIGYPLGAPETLSTGARILLDNPGRQSFITNLDAFEGNSGSPVFDQNGAVVGILTAGTPLNSLVDTPSGCQRFNKCDENGANCLLPDTKTLTGFQHIGSEIQRIQPVQDLITSFESID